MCVRCLLVYIRSCPPHLKGGVFHVTLEPRTHAGLHVRHGSLPVPLLDFVRIVRNAIDNFSSTVALSLTVPAAAMADTNSNQTPAELTTGIEGPPAGSEVQEHVFPPWGNGNPSAPTVDDEDDSVRLNIYDPFHSPQSLRFAYLSLTELR
jgi:hypothetical protein